MGRLAVSLAAVLLGAASASAQQQFPAAGVGDPEIRQRCQHAPTLTQRTICDNPDLALLERDIHRYLNIAKRRDPGRAAALDAAQLAFERQRERACGGLAAPQDYDGPAYRCLRLHQRTRLVQLATQAGSGLSGLYRAQRPDMSGELMIVEWPDGHAQVVIDTLTPPDARTCSIQFSAPAGPALAGTPQGAPGCRVGIDALGRTATVRADGDCRTVCVLGGRPDGVYRR
jgi:hypothetical protein